MFRFSLLGLAGATTVSAAACAVLVFSSNGLTSLVWTITVITLVFALMSALLVEPARRGFWVGFAVCGWIYVQIPFGLGRDLASLMSLDSALTAVAEAMPQSKKRTTIPTARRSGDPYGWSVRRTTTRDNEFVNSFVRTAHAILALLSASAGGVVGSHIHRRNLVASHKTSEAAEGRLPSAVLPPHTG